MFWGLLFEEWGEKSSFSLFLCDSKMAPVKNLKVTLTEQEPGNYVLSWQNPDQVENVPSVQNVTLHQVQADFPDFCKAVTDCHTDLNPVVPLDQFMMCAAYSYVESSMRKKRFLVYTHIAYAAGFADRT